MLKWHNIDAAAATIGLPVASASLASVPFAESGHPVLGAVTSGVVAVGTVAANLLGRRARAKRDSSAAYLLDVERLASRADPPDPPDA